MNNITSAIAWLKNRCLLRYRESNDSQTLSIINLIDNTYQNIIECNISTAEINSIINKYYFDFNMDKSTNNDGFSMGFSDADRAALRHNILNIYKDITQNIVYQNKQEATNLETKDIFDNEEILHVISNNS
jgi:hypothetical protein